jgi:branched-chain amino acid transport system permease protein
VILETRGLSKHFGGVHAVTEVNFSVRSGEVRALIGPNGAGKSTFFKMLTGEHIPTAGEIYFRGDQITAQGPTAVSQLGMSKSYQINQLFASLTVRQNLTIPVLARQRGPFRLDMLRRLDRWGAVNRKVEEIMQLMGLAERADQPTSVLAYGEKRRLEIGLALAMEPEVLLLDEPLAGMSPSERADTIALLQELRIGRTLVVVEHDMDAVFELAEHITVFYEGEKLAEGTPEDIKGNSQVQDAYLGGMDEDELA